MNCVEAIRSYVFRCVVLVTHFLLFGGNDMKKKISCFLVLLITFCTICIGFKHPEGYLVSYAETTTSEKQNSWGNHVYQVFDIAMTWHEAKNYCENLGGHLATITSKNENLFVSELLANSVSNCYWLGATDEEKEGVWSWVTGEEFTYNNWKNSEPNNQGKSEHYLEMFGKTYNNIKVGQWNDIMLDGFNGKKDNDFYSDESIGFICEWENETTKHSFNGHFYQVYEESMTWTEAEDFCKNLGGHLVTITSAEENDFISEFIVGSDKNNCYWIGASDVDEEGDWVWVTGEEFTYTNWKKDEPNNQKKLEHYLEIYANTYEDIQVGQWNDVILDGRNGDKNKSFYSSSKIGFICEWDYSAEDIMFLRELPVLSPSEAEAFLNFLYNGNLDGIDITQDINYKLLTGSLSGMTTHEIKNLISAFCLIVEIKVNGYIDNASYHSDYFTNSLITRLENQLPSGLEIVGSEITDAIGELVNDQIGQNLGLLVDDYGLLDAATSINAITTLATLPSSVLEFCEKVSIAVDAINLVNSSDRLGRYGYFNSYLDCLNNFSGDALNFATDAQFFLHTNNTAASQLNGIINKKIVWTDQREDIEKWAEYVYKLGQYQYKDEHNYIDIVIETTCDNQGYTLHECVYCSDIYKDNYKNALGHKYKSTNYKPTCVNDGYDFYSCFRCGDSYKANVVSPTGHINFSVNTVLPSCTKSGYEKYTCACGTSWTDNEVDALGHSYLKTVVEPTETEQGYTINKCSSCADTYYSDYVNPTGHEFTVTITAPTCENEGYTTHTCDGCGYEYVDNYISMLSHSYVLMSEIKATCTDQGVKEYDCQNCETTYSESISAKEHDYSYGMKTTDPTCEEQGFTTHICECGDSYDDSYIDALGHEFNIIETVDSSCVEDGYVKYECSVCEKSYSDVIFAPDSGHVFELTEVVEGDCLHCGYTLKNCTVCGVGKYENMVYADGHNVGSWQTIKSSSTTSTGLQERHCLDCDFVESEIIPEKQFSKTIVIRSFDDLIEFIFDICYVLFSKRFKLNF